VPAYVAPFVGFSIGVLFSWAAGEELTRASGPLGSTRSLMIVVLFAFLIFGPMAGYFLAYATDWSLAYLVDGRHVPSALMLVGVLLDVAVVLLGFAVVGCLLCLVAGVAWTTRELRLLSVAARRG